MVVNKFQKESRRYKKARGRKFKKRILIVCEGKTEENYFGKVKDYLHLQTCHIRIENNKRSDSEGIFKAAKQEQKKQAGNEYDIVYCVFDKDNNTYFDETIKKIDRKKILNMCVLIHV